MFEDCCYAPYVKVAFQNATGVEDDMRYHNGRNNKKRKHKK